MDHPLQNLATFLVLAHQNTYANKAIKKVSASRLGSRDYDFEQGDFSYHDTYFGSRYFIGEEIVYFRGKPTWGMNYYGFADTEADTILRPFLMQEPWAELPVRGPKHSIEGSREYILQIREGAIERFVAEERIIEGDAILHRCFLHGGLIQ